MRFENDEATLEPKGVCEGLAPVQPSSVYLTDMRRVFHRSIRRYVFVG
jgi:hypothetical protein